MKKQLIYVAIASALMSNWAGANEDFDNSKSYLPQINVSGDYGLFNGGKVVVEGEKIDTVWKLSGDSTKKREENIIDLVGNLSGDDHNNEVSIAYKKPENPSDNPYQDQRINSMFTAKNMTINLVLPQVSDRGYQPEIELYPSFESTTSQAGDLEKDGKTIIKPGDGASFLVGTDLVINIAEKVKVVGGEGGMPYQKGFNGDTYTLTEETVDYYQAGKGGNTFVLTNSILNNRGEIYGGSANIYGDAPGSNAGGAGVLAHFSKINNYGFIQGGYNGKMRSGGGNDGESYDPNGFDLLPFSNRLRPPGTGIIGSNLEIYNSKDGHISGGMQNPELHFGYNFKYDIENQQWGTGINVQDSTIDNEGLISGNLSYASGTSHYQTMIGGSGIEGQNVIINNKGKIVGGHSPSIGGSIPPTVHHPINIIQVAGAGVVGGQLKIYNYGIISETFEGESNPGSEIDLNTGVNVVGDIDYDYDAAKGELGLARENTISRRGDAVRFTSGTKDENLLYMATGSELWGNIAVSQGNYVFRYNLSYKKKENEPTEQTVARLVNENKDNEIVPIKGGLHLYDNSRVYTEGTYGLVFEGRIISSNKAHITVANYINEKEQIPQYITADNLYICGGEGNNTLYTACSQPSYLGELVNDPEQKPLLDMTRLVLDPKDPKDRDKLWDQQRKLLIVLNNPDPEKRIIGEFGSEFDFTSIEHDPYGNNPDGGGTGLGEVRYVLSWFHVAKPHGNFTLNGGESFTLIRELDDQVLEGKTPKYDWDGKSLTKKGVGLMNLNSISTYTGSTTIEAGTLKTLKVDAFKNTSGVNIYKDAILNLGGNSQQIGNMVNEGTVLIDDMNKTPIVGLDVTLTGNVQNSGLIVLNNYSAHYDPRNRMTITGDYKGGDGKNIVGRLNLGVNKDLADKLYIGGTASGRTLVNISNENTGTRILQNLELIVTGKSEESAFLQDNRVISGGLEYYLRRGSQISPELNDNNWYLTTCSVCIPTDPTNPGGGNPTGPTYRPEGGGYITNHNSANTIFNLPIYDIQRNDRHLWGYVAGGYRTFTSTNSDQNETRSNRYVFEVGGDFINQSGQYREKDLLQVGLMAGYGYEKGKTHNIVSGYNAKSHLRGYNIGVYGIWQENAEDKTGWGVAGKLYWNHFRNSVQGDQLQEEKYNSRGFVASASVQYSFLANEWISALSDNRNRVYIQPKLDITWMGVKAKDHTEYNKTRVSSLGNNNIQLVPGVRFQTDSFGKYSGNIYTEINWIYNSKRFGVQMNEDRIYQRGFRNAFNAKFGGKVKLNRDSEVWADLDYIQGESSYLDVKFTLGYQYHF